MKKTIAIILILVLVPAFIQAKDTLNEEEIMSRILTELEGVYVKGDISANQVVYEEFYQIDILEGIGENIKEYLEVDEIERLIQDEKNYCQINYYGYDNDNNKVTIIISSYFDEEQKNGETFLYINFLNTEQFLNINGIIENVESLYNKYDSNAEITTNIVGIIDSQIDLDDYENRIKKTIEKNNGKILDRYKSDNLISYNAYTESIKNYIELGKDKINLNIAIRCNKTEDTTVIYIGTPIIVGGY